MSDDAKVALGISLVSMIFGAGGVVMWTRVSISNLRKDLNGIGRKVNDSERDAARRYHNTSLAIIISAPASKEDEVSKLLKENC